LPLDPTRKLLERSFLDFQELKKHFLKFLGIQNPFYKKGFGGVRGNAPRKAKGVRGKAPRKE
jgi:hypothetical protein